MTTTDDSALADTSAEVRTFIANRIGFIELNRPKALNALSLGMIRTMHARLDEWRTDPGVLAVVVYSPHERAFCAGGDVRSFYEMSQRNDVASRERFFIEEYSLDHAIFIYPKPYIALMSGIVMGGGMGISQGAHRTGGLRVVTSTTRMAMPETRIGFFPDVGAGWFLARTPGAIGRYLAVTGVTIGAADALYAGLADICMNASAIPTLLEALGHESFATGTDVIACVKRIAHEAICANGDEHADTSLAATRAWIDRHFGQPDAAAIAASLAAEREEGACDWAEDTLGMMHERSPLSMAVSLEVVARGDSTMAECLRRDLDLTHTMFAFGDVLEGVRARIIDKDNHPVWRIGRIGDVTAQDVERMFMSPWRPDEHPLRALHG